MILVVIYLIFFAESFESERLMEKPVLYVLEMKKKTRARGSTPQNCAQTHMILTTCAVCAAPLADDAPAHCVNCQTKYCSDRCLRYHAHRGGHDDACDEIARSGGAEQYHTDKNYNEAVATAVEACAEDTTQSIWSPRESLKRRNRWRAKISPRLQIAMDPTTL